MATPDAHLPRQVPIDGYGRGAFHFAGMASEGSVLALPSGIHAWAAATPADIDPAALRLVMEQAAQIELLLIGTGRDPWPLPEALRWRLRDAGIAAEIYLGSSGMKAQMKYADRRSAPIAVIQGSNEKDAGEVTVKDLVQGAEMSKSIDDRSEWIAARPAQVTVKEADLVETVRAMLAAQKG